MAEARRAEAEEEAERNTDVEEQAALARAEGEAAAEALRAGERRAADAHNPEAELSHLPAPIRGPMVRMTQWMISREIHNRFITFCKGDRNEKRRHSDALFTAEIAITYVRYAEQLAKCKSMAQWKARALASGVPAEAALSVRTAGESIRQLAVRFFFDSQPGDVLTADMKSRDFFIHADVETYLTQ